MSNPFFKHPGDGDEPAGSGRVYGAFEVPEPLGDGAPPRDDDDDEPVLFECVDTSWLSWGQNGGRTWLDNYRDAPLSVLQLTSFPMPPLPQGAEPGDIAWFEFGYSPSSEAESNGRIYTSLYGAGSPVRVNYYEPRELGWSGGSAMGFKGWLDVAPNVASGTDGEMSKAFRKHLQGLPSSAGVAVYDVGQGSCHALVHDIFHQPLMYIDFGGGVLVNRATFPKEHRGFCFSNSPVVLLTHWDWDHWSSAYLFPRSMEQRWVGPPVPLKPIQQAFAADLYTRGSLRIWDSSWPSVLRGNGVRIERCTGRTSNDSGLAVTLFAKRASGQNCLLPGDASYRFIPSVSSGERFSSLCLTHHGGRLHSKTYPVPKRGATALLSAGPGNTFRHPLMNTLEAHAAAGWPFPLPTGFAGKRPCNLLQPWGNQPQLFHGSCPIGECGTAVHRFVTP